MARRHGSVSFQIGLLSYYSDMSLSMLHLVALYGESPSFASSDGLNGATMKESRNRYYRLALMYISNAIAALWRSLCLLTSCCVTRRLDCFTVSAPIRLQYKCVSVQSALLIRGD